MPANVLGLDIGGANLKAATVDKRAVSVPFALWKQPDKLPVALAQLVSQFPDAEEFAVTMTGELCDCYETKREGVNAILTAVQNVSRSYPIRVWSTEGAFLTVEESRRDYLKVAAANWHALATFVGRYVPNESGLLLDVGSTTTDLIPIRSGIPRTQGSTDFDRLRFRELVYRGVRRTPVCAIVSEKKAAELFATTQDVYLLLGHLPEHQADFNTADGRPATREYATSRLARMLGGDRETIPERTITQLATRVHEQIVNTLLESVMIAYGAHAKRPPDSHTVIVSGAGEFLARQVAEIAFEHMPERRFVSLREELGPTVSASAPAYALAVLGTERWP